MTDFKWPVFQFLISVHSATRPEFLPSSSPVGPPRPTTFILLPNICPLRCGYLDYSSKTNKAPSAYSKRHAASAGMGNHFTSVTNRPLQQRSEAAAWQTPRTPTSRDSMTAAAHLHAVAVHECGCHIRTQGCHVRNTTSGVPRQHSHGPDILLLEASPARSQDSSCNPPPSPATPILILQRWNSP